MLIFSGNCSAYKSIFTDFILSSFYQQKGSLLFIVRDWENDDEDVDYPHGLEGGKKYFDRTTKPNAQKAEEHKMMQKFFHNAFGEISCFLLPEPGKAVKKRDVTLRRKL